MSPTALINQTVFEALGDGRARLYATSPCCSPEDRAAWLLSGMEDDMEESIDGRYDRLDAMPTYI